MGWGRGTKGRSSAESLGDSGGKSCSSMAFPRSTSAPEKGKKGKGGKGSRGFSGRGGGAFFGQDNDDDLMIEKEEPEVKTNPFFQGEQNTFFANADEDDAPKRKVPSNRIKKGLTQLEQIALNDPVRQKEEMNLKKKLREIDDLQKRQDAGENLASNQLQKLESKGSLLAKLEQMNPQRPKAEPDIDEIKPEDIQKELQELAQDRCELEGLMSTPEPMTRVISAPCQKAAAKKCPSFRPQTVKRGHTVGSSGQSSAWGKDGARNDDAHSEPIPISRSWRPEQPNEFDDLADPDVVFDCCDTDRSRGLDLFQLKFALNAFGLFPPHDRIEDWMDERESLNKQEFKELLRQKQNSAPSNMKRPRAIPYARRGVSQGQLEAMHHAAVESGWLQDRCDAFNLEHACDIQAGKVHSLGVNLYALDRFVIRPATTPKEHSSEDVLTLPEEIRVAAHVPQATHLCSYSELVNANGVLVDFFVSHWWGHPFAETIYSLRQWAVQKHRAIDKTHPHNVVYWLCFLALNQHYAGEEVGSSPEEGPFNAALMQASHGAVMILDEKVNPFKRIWCLYEVKRITDLQQDFELICSMGTVSGILEYAPEQSSKRKEALEYVWKIENALTKVSAFNAAASSDDDKFAIWHRISDPRFRNIPLATLRSKKMLGSWAFKRFDARIGTLLAAPLLKASLQDHDGDAALRYIALGAEFDDEHLEVLKQLGKQILSLKVPVKRGRIEAVNWTLLHCAAGFGHVAGADYLLKLKANIEVRTEFGSTPLFLSTTNDQLEVSELLISRGAEIDGKNNENRTPLHGTVICGYTRCTELLLAKGADILNVQDKKGDSVLHASVLGGHSAVVSLLLEHRADVTVKNHAGMTALHYAARDNHAECARLLLEEASALGVKDKLVKARGYGRRNSLAVELAEHEGHHELVNFLNDH